MSEACYDEIKYNLETSSVHNCFPQINSIEFQISEISNDKWYSEKYELALSDETIEYF